MKQGTVYQRHLAACPRDDAGRLVPHRCRGPWAFAIDSGRRPDGGRRQSTQAGFATKRQAQAALRDAQARQQAGVAAVEGVTVNEFLDTWLSSKRKLRETTRRNYRTHIRRYLRPALGGLRLADLAPHHIDQLYSDLIDGRYVGATPTTVHHVHRTLRSALNSAVKRRLIAWNPAQHVELPEHQRAQAVIWQPEEVGRFLDNSADHRLYGLFHLIAFTGMRRGEAIGLHWTDVNLEAQLVVVRCQVTDAGDGPKLGPPKSESGTRVVPIDAYTGHVLQRQQAHQQRERAAWGGGWQDLGLVFTKEDGGLLRPDAITHLFTKLVTQAGLPRIRLHDLRHTHASLALAAGVDIKVVSNRLGHSTTAITADLYTQVTPAVARRAADAIASEIPLARATEARDVSGMLAPDRLRRSGTDPPEDVSAGQDESRHGDSNPEPSDYKSGALPIAPCRQGPQPTDPVGPAAGHQAQ
jgi:integrase